MRFRVLFVAAVLFAPALTAQQSTAKRPITAEDYFQFELVSDPRVSPDGSRVVYVVSRVDRAQNRRVPSVWIASTTGGTAPRVLVDESYSPSAPRWSPDGASVAFTSARAPEGGAGAAGAARGRSQLWVVNATSGAPKRITDVANGVSGCVWSPDAKRSVCLVR